MAKRDATKEKLAALKALDDAPLNQEMEKELKKSLARRNNIIVSKVFRGQPGERENVHQVIAECLSTLVQINPERSMGFVEQFLSYGDLILAENAAFALGESRLEEAFEILCRHREKSCDPEFQDMLLTPMAVTRLEEAFAYLIDILENGSRKSAVAAVNAVKIFGDEIHLSKIREVVKSRNDAKVSEVYAAWRLE